MVVRMIMLTCTTCGSKVKCHEKALHHVLDGKAHCPRCHSTLHAGDGTMGWETDDAAHGQTVYMSAGSLLRIKSTRGIAVASFTTSELREADEVRELERHLTSLLDEHGFRFIVLNFDGVAFMSSGVLTVLVQFRLRVREAGGEMALSDIPHDIRNVFKITHMQDLFLIHRGEDQAFKALSKIMQAGQAH